MMSADDTDLEDTSDGLQVTVTPSEKMLHSDKKLRLGVVGKPSDWLISSGVDYKEVLERMNCELVDIPIEEMTSLGEVDPGMKGAEAIYERLKEIVHKYDLQGVTLRCFDLLSTVKNTGCIALSKLNDEGIPAACEGDIPTLLTMMVCKKQTGELCFQVNPARIKADGEMLFAHCTLPLGMTEKHEYTTHFESGIGVAIHGDLPAGDYTLVKMSGDMKRLLAVDVELERCQFESNLCRTQVWIKANPAVSQYFLTTPIANHHVLIRGHHAKQFT
jgi:L-fucose isomerase-like protein